MSTGRACLTVILERLRPACVYVPFYTCNTVLAPFARLGIQTRLYQLDESLFPTKVPSLEDGEYVLWTDYFGVCAGHTERLKASLGDRLLIDDTHNFFCEGHHNHWSFTSARKYFGVPDGAYLYSPQKISFENVERFTGISLKHGVLRRLGRQNEAFAEYQAYERSLDCTVRRISEISEGLLRGVSLTSAAAARRANFVFFHDILGSWNQLSLLPLTQVPFCYPYLPSRPIEHHALHAHGFFVPRLWPEVTAKEPHGFDFERRLSAQLLPLPIDHRYSPEDLEPIVHYLSRMK